MFTETKRSLCALLLFLTIGASSCIPDPPMPTPDDKSIPTARAGNDFNIYLPTERKLQINGGGSYDPDGRGTQMAYTWTKLSGPEVYEFQFDKPLASMTVYETGTYVFELKVEDVQKNIARDTVTVTAKWGLGCDLNTVYTKSNFQPVYSLNELVPVDVSIGISGENLVFAGGRLEWDDGWGGSDIYDSIIFVYNAASNTTIKRKLSGARANIGIAITRSEVFMAGGIMPGNVSDVVDIFNLDTKTLRQAKLSVARSSIRTVVAGQLVFFAGGRDKNNETLDVVDIYDQNSDSWSVAKLSLPRADMAAVAIGSKVVFAGGDLGNYNGSTRIDIYDLNSHQWSTAELPSSRSLISATVLGDEIVLDGGFPGQNSSGAVRVDQIDFFNPMTKKIRTVCMLGREAYGMEYGQNLNTVVLGNQLYYLGTKVISSHTPGESTWKMSFRTTTDRLLAVYSSGGQLYGLSANDNVYMMGIQMFKINF